MTNSAGSSLRDDEHSGGAANCGPDALADALPLQRITRWAWRLLRGYPYEYRGCYVYMYRWHCCVAVPQSALLLRATDNERMGVSSKSSDTAIDHISFKLS